MAATRGRELRLELVTDTRRFAADDAARDLDDLADAAGDAARDLDDLSDAGAGLSRIGDDAHAAAGDVDGAFGDAKDSIKGAANEAAAGFDGSMDSVVGSAQGAVAEIGSSMGGLAGVGLLAGAALAGALWSKVSAAAEAAQERVDGLRDRIRELGKTGGEIQLPDLRDWIDEQTSEDLTRMASDARKLGVSVADIARARYGDADAIAKVTTATRDLERANGDAAGSNQQANRWLEDKLGLEEDVKLGSLTLIDVTDDLSTATRELAGDTAAATEADAARSQALGGLTDELIELNTAVAESAAGIVTSSDDITQAMAQIPDGVLAASQAAADASTSLADTWADNVTNVGAAADEIIAQQRADIDATRQYYADLETAYAAGGTDLVNYILNSESPADTAKLVAKMSPEDQAEVAANYAELGDLSSQALIKAQNAGLDKAAADAKTKGTAAGKAYSDGVAAGITANAGKISSAAKAANPGSGGSTGASYWANTSGKKVP